jgi:transposase
MPSDDLNSFEKEEQQRHDAAIKALEFFINKYSPASDITTAEAFITTKEIVQAIADHTGVALASAEVYEMMVHMGYNYDAVNGLEFNWLMRKE